MYIYKPESRPCCPSIIRPVRAAFRVKPEIPPELGLQVQGRFLISAVKNLGHSTVFELKMAEKSHWPNKKDDYELLDVIGNIAFYYLQLLTKKKTIKSH